MGCTVKETRNRVVIRLVAFAVAASLVCPNAAVTNAYALAPKSIFERNEGNTSTTSTFGNKTPPQTTSTSESTNINNLSATELRLTLRQGYESGRIQRVSQFEDWQQLRTDKKKQLVAGLFILRKINGQWCLLLAQRNPDRAKDKQGFFSAPVGGVNKPFNSAIENPQHVQELTQLGLMSPNDTDPAGKRESIVGAAIREASEEVHIPEEGKFLEVTQLHGRIDDFRGNHEGILVNFMVHIDDSENPSVHLSDELINPQWIPLDLILHPAPEFVGLEVEKYLRGIVPDCDLMHGLKTAGLRNLQNLILQAMPLQENRESAIAQKIGFPQWLSTHPGVDVAHAAVQLWKSLEDSGYDPAEFYTPLFVDFFIRTDQAKAASGLIEAIEGVHSGKYPNAAVAAEAHGIANVYEIQIAFHPDGAGGILPVTTAVHPSGNQQPYDQMFARNIAARKPAAMEILKNAPEKIEDSDLESKRVFRWYGYGADSPLPESFGISLALPLQLDPVAKETLDTIKARIKETQAFKNKKIKFYPESCIHNTLRTYRMHEDTPIAGGCSSYMERLQTVPELAACPIFLEGINWDSNYKKLVLQAYSTDAFRILGKSVQDEQQLKAKQGISFSFAILVKGLSKEEMAELNNIVKEFFEAPLGTVVVDKLALHHHRNDMLIDSLEVREIPLTGVPATHAPLSSAETVVGESALAPKSMFESAAERERKKEEAKLVVDGKLDAGLLNYFVEQIAAEITEIGGIKVKVTAALGGSAVYLADENGLVPLHLLHDIEIAFNFTTSPRADPSKFGNVTVGSELERRLGDQFKGVLGNKRISVLCETSNQRSTTAIPDYTHFPPLSFFYYHFAFQEFALAEFPLSPEKLVKRYLAFEYYYGHLPPIKRSGEEDDLYRSILNRLKNGIWSQALWNEISSHPRWPAIKEFIRVNTKQSYTLSEYHPLLEKQFAAFAGSSPVVRNLKGLPKTAPAETSARAPRFSTKAQQYLTQANLFAQNRTTVTENKDPIAIAQAIGFNEWLSTHPGVDDTHAAVQLWKSLEDSDYNPAEFYTPLFVDFFIRTDQAKAASGLIEAIEGVRSDKYPNATVAAEVHGIANVADIQIALHPSGAGGILNQGTTEKVLKNRDRAKEELRALFAAGKKGVVHVTGKRPRDLHVLAMDWDGVMVQSNQLWKNLYGLLYQVMAGTVPEPASIRDFDFDTIDIAPGYAVLRDQMGAPAFDHIQTLHAMAQQQGARVNTPEYYAKLLARWAADYAPAQMGEDPTAWRTSGSKSLLDKMRLEHPNIPLFVVSGALGDFVRWQIGAIGYDKYFQQIFASKMTEGETIPKNKKDILEHLIQANGIQSDQAVLFEDGATGIQLAKAAGAVAMGVANNLENGLKLIDAGADIILVDMAVAPDEIIQALALEPPSLIDPNDIDSGKRLMEATDKPQPLEPAKDLTGASL